MGLQKVKQGSFDYTPNKYFPYLMFKRVGYVTVFNADSNYVYTNPVEQGDWLKLGGVAFALFPWDKHSNTAMVAFRWNPNLQVMELLDYVHVNKVTDNGIGRTPIATVALGERFAWWIRADAAKKIVSINIVTKTQGVVTKTWDMPQISTGICWPVGAYAGGDQPAVQDMSFYEDRIIEWGLNGPSIIKEICPTCLS